MCSGCARSGCTRAALELSSDPRRAGYFAFWVIISLVWGLLATVVITVLPLWESRHGLATVFGNMLAGRSAQRPEEYADKSFAGDVSVKKPEETNPNAQV